MRELRGWIERRSATIGLALFFLIWYVIELAVLHRYGETFARWLFYTDLPPRITGGLVFSPISHDFYDLTHIGGNLVMLLGIGGLVEPYTGEWKVPGLVIIGGYIGTFVTMATATVHHFWPIAGASTGVLLLWGYAGLRMWSELDFSSDIQLDGVEAYATLFLVTAIPAIPLYELLVNGNMSHLTGMVLGVVYFGFEIGY